jgi:Flp pilus assembly protein TadG
MKKMISGKIHTDESGVSVTEFGLIAPVVATLMMGAMDAGHTLYMRTVLDGSIQDIARDSALEDGSILAKQEAIDSRIRTHVKNLNDKATVVVKRRYYRNFSTAASAQEEEYDDTNEDGTCNKGESYTDSNQNEVWDSDGGDGGQGGAKDVSIVTVTVTYDRLFPMASLIGLPKKVKVASTTVLANQPYGDQERYGAALPRNCDNE